MRKSAVIIAALFFMLALPASALAATSSASASEGLSINSIVGLTLSTSAINFGANDPGTTTPVVNFNANVSGNAVGWTLSTVTTDLQAPGPIVIPANPNAQVQFNGGGWSVQPASGSITGPTGNGAATVVVGNQWTIPAGQTAGTYASSMITVTVTAP